MLSDIEIAQASKLHRIIQLAQTRLGIPDESLSPYGHYKAKLSLDYIDGLQGRPDGKLILVTAISPTPAGEGKTTTTVGLGDALNHIGHKAVICLREPSLGPVFGMKGGAAGGGHAQVVPMEDINLHFTGDFSAVALANNLLAALIDNHIHHGNELGFDVRRVTWKRVMDMNDRALRDITIALGGPANGYPREDGFDIVVASEVMAILCLATSLDDLKARLGRIVVGSTADQRPIRAVPLGRDPAHSAAVEVDDVEGRGPHAAVLRECRIPRRAERDAPVREPHRIGVVIRLQLTGGAAELRQVERLVRHRDLLEAAAIDVDLVDPPRAGVRDRACAVVARPNSRKHELLAVVRDVRSVDVNQVQRRGRRVAAVYQRAD